MGTSRRNIGYLLLREKPQQLGICTWCREPVQKPRRYWCSDDCVNEYQIRANPQITRTALAKRDHEVCQRCGLDCRWLQTFLDDLERIHRPDDPDWLIRRYPSHDPFRHWDRFSTWLISDDTKRLWGWVEKLHGSTREQRPELFELHGQHSVLAPVHAKSYMSWRDWFCCEVLGLRLNDARRRTYWEADHIVAVADGGWALGLENFRTLCLWCHRARTTKQNRT